jgi:hypothetical protein
MGAVLLVPYLTASTLLLVAGLEKARRPFYTRDAFAALGLPGGDAAIRTLGAIEFVAGTIAIASTFGMPGAAAAAAAVAALYLMFGIAVLRLLADGTAVRSCGCLGSADTPPSYAHAAVNFGCAVVAALWALQPTTLGAAAHGRPLVYAIALASAALALYLINAVILWLSSVWTVTKLPDAGDGRPA